MKQDNQIRIELKFDKLWIKKNVLIVETGLPGT
jgi:hypothetical protein